MHPLLVTLACVAIAAFLLLATAVVWQLRLTARTQRQFEQHNRELRTRNTLGYRQYTPEDEE